MATLDVNNNGCVLSVSEVCMDQIRPQHGENAAFAEAVESAGWVLADYGQRVGPNIFLISLKMLNELVNGMATTT